MQVGAEFAAVSDEDLASSPASVRALLVSMAARITALEARVIELERENVALRAENALLREKLGLNSSNSGKPPSSDGPGVTSPPSKPSKNKRGGQLKHPRHRRELIPVEKVDQVQDLRPSHGIRCGEVTVHGAHGCHAFFLPRADTYHPFPCSGERARRAGLPLAAVGFSPR